MQADFNTAAVPVMTVTGLGNKAWRVNGQLHREDGPAVEYANGDNEWRVNGQLHREDGPAVEYANGDKAWYRDGKLHREDEPAIAYANGTKEWWLNGKQLDGDEIAALQARLQKQKSMEFHKSLTEVLTKGFEKDLVAPTTARFKLKVRA